MSREGAADRSSSSKMTSLSSSPLGRCRYRPSFSMSDSPRLRIRAVDLELFIPRDELRCHPIVTELEAAASAHCRVSQVLGLVALAQLCARRERVRRDTLEGDGQEETLLGVCARQERESVWLWARRCIKGIGSRRSR